MTSLSDPDLRLGLDPVAPQRCGPGASLLNTVNGLILSFEDQLTTTESATSAMRQLTEALKHQLSSVILKELIEQQRQEIDHLKQQLIQKDVDLLEKEEVIKSKDVTCSTFARELQRLSGVLRQRSREYHFPFPDEVMESISLYQNSELLSPPHGHSSSAQSINNQSQVKDDVQPRPAEGESIQPSTIATTATMSEMESMVSESSSGTSSVSNSLHSTSMESHQSHRSRSDVGPTAPPESLDSWTKGQLIARISSLQDDLRKVAMINAKWKTDYEEMKVNMQKEIDRLAEALRHREEDKRRREDTKKTSVAVQEAIETVEREKQAAQREVHQLRSQLNDIKTELRGTQQQLDEVLSYKEQDEQAVEALKEQLRTALASLETNRGDCERLTRDNNTLRGENVALKGQVRSLDTKLIDIRRKLRDLMTDPETEEAQQRPVLPPRDKASQRTTSKSKSKPLSKPEMLYKQLEKQTGDPGRFRRTAGDHGQHMGSQKSTGEGGVVPRGGTDEIRTELELPSNVTIDDEESQSAE